MNLDEKKDYLVGELKDRHILGGRMQVAILITFIVIVTGSLVIISAAMTQLTNTAMKSELHSVGYLAIESIKDQKGSDFSYNPDTGEFYCGQMLINKHMNVLQEMKEYTDCRLCFFAGQERIYVPETDAGKESGIHTFLNNDAVWKSIQKKEPIFITNIILDGKPYCSLYLPILQESSGEVFGMLSIGKPMEIYDDFTTDIKIFCTIVLVLLTVICSYSLYRFINVKIGTITDLNRQVTEIAKDFGTEETDLSRRAVVKRRDEVGLLAHSFNLFFMKMENMFGNWKNRTGELLLYIHSSRSDVKMTLEKLEALEDKTQNYEVLTAIHKVEKNLDVLNTMAKNLKNDFDCFKTE